MRDALTVAGRWAWLAVILGTMALVAWAMTS